MVVKLNDGALMTPPDKITFTNPPEQLLKDYAGYKDYIDSPAPDYNPETEYLVPEYSETDTQIICHWQIKQLPEQQAGGEKNGV